ncbi:MAG: bifunctional tRNA (adenosine(37)-C2)-methyltransferase TrmG/ribosomal RNA large subunit methyltransferase RlmN, partial [Candidatus Electrothrix sp. GM3_4]|nr:bifunctional tRNA (adenosine(37)-C2)-methyltransferase TrmG/ribosomal RNA large subunit methyltransferase RlmN [Candidatus Electrothrix sp. GM3_4]
IPCKINLLSVNKGEGDEFISPSNKRILRFQELLREENYTVFIRQSRGADISAACGQLAGKVAKQQQEEKEEGKIREGIQK